MAAPVRRVESCYNRAFQQQETGRSMAEDASETPVEQPTAPDLGVLHDYDYFDQSEGDHASAYVFELAGAGRRILELGAGSGAQTRFLAKDGKNIVVAADINAASVEKLRRITPHAYQVDLEKPAWTETFRGEGPFDTIIAADVLEHLYDPWSALATMKTLLAPEGDIIVSLPYIGNAAILGLISDDDFQYREEGLLDKTHIRFFGLRNIAQLHEHAGLKIIDARFVLRPPQTTEFHPHWNSLPPRVKAALTINPRSDIYQIVTKARRSECVTSPIDLMAAADRRCPPRRLTLRQRIAHALLGAEA
jgi:2-polyprenyl-3-methyl-5-hydroxy-6-metoxy-1,4-benzoquinol methylase